MFKKLLIFFIMLFASPFIVALFVQKDYSVVRSVVIEKPLPEVFAYVKLLKNQNEYSKWAQIDPQMEKSFTGVDGTPGFISAWASEHPDVGVGEQEILSVVDGQRIEYQLRFISPFESTSPAYMQTTAISGQQTQVDWGFSGHMNYPMNIMFLFMDFEAMIGDDLQQGLDNLKVIVEQ
ncbi:SRPBCC family protein [Shewanella maritima]|uniref:SRPBCC family protein n=1 Tax=Shewanella maritima TaxID=2520507 RepID=UPI00373605B0